MTRHLHPLRCETCNNKDCWYHLSKQDINQYGVNNSAWAHSKNYGCASHSNIINQQDDPCIECIHIKKEIQDAREKVLDELTKLRETGEYHLGMFHKLEEYERLWREEWDWIKSLRTTKGDVKTP